MPIPSTPKIRLAVGKRAVSGASDLMTAAHFQNPPAQFPREPDSEPTGSESKKGEGESKEGQPLPSPLLKRFHHQKARFESGGVHLAVRAMTLAGRATTENAGAFDGLLSHPTAKQVCRATGRPGAFPANAHVNPQAPRNALWDGAGISLIQAIPESAVGAYPHISIHLGLPHVDFTGFCQRNRTASGMSHFATKCANSRLSLPQNPQFQAFRSIIMALFP